MSTDLIQWIAIVGLVLWLIGLTIKLSETDREARSYKSPPRY